MQNRAYDKRLNDYYITYPELLGSYSRSLLHLNERKHGREIARGFGFCGKN